MAGSKRVIFDIIQDEDKPSAELDPYARFKARKMNSLNKDSEKTLLQNTKKELGENKRKNEENLAEMVDPSKKMNIQTVATINKHSSSFEKEFENLKRSKYFKLPDTQLPSSSKERKPPDKNKEINKTAESSTAKISKNRNCIIASSVQRKNAVLKFIRNIPVQYENMVPDFLINETTCAIFLSLRYHLFNPNYIHEKLKSLGHLYRLRILLVHVDVKDPHHSIKELTKIALLANCTLLLAWSLEEAGRYLEIYKVFENKPPDILMEKQESSSVGRLMNALTSVKSVNKTDAKTLLSNFNSFKNIVQADKEQLSFCPGIGPQKAARLYDVVNEPFLKRCPEKSNSPK